MTDNRKPRCIVRGQKIENDKAEFARQQRKEMSPVERVLWRRLRHNQIEGAHFRRQQVIAGYTADFYCHSAALAVEVDGMTHDDPEYDEHRDAVLASRGIRVMRFTNDQVLRQTEDVLQAIWDYVTSRKSKQ